MILPVYMLRPVQIPAVDVIQPDLGKALKCMCACVCVCVPLGMHAG